jgi:acetyl esterase
MSTPLAPLVVAMSPCSPVAGLCRAMRSQGRPDGGTAMRVALIHLAAIATVLASGTPSFGQGKPAAIGPVAHVFAKRGGVELKAYVFSPEGTKGGRPRAAIVLFHGGGWAIGEPGWAFGRAQHFAERGMVAVAAQYRLSHENITPLDAIDDARAAIRWVRSHAGDLGVDPKRIAAYGWSAGGHLAACAAIFNGIPADATVSSAPNALVLVSPAVSVGAEGCYRRLLRSKGEARDSSPDEHVRPRLPPTVIVEGRQDTVTSLPGVRRFADRMKAAGNRCELYVFDGAGHLFTPVGTPDDGFPKPDPTIESAAFSRLDAFLVSLGYMK